MRITSTMSPRLPLMIPFVVIVCLLAAGGGATAATQLSWYGNGTHLGGGGTWNTTSSDWSASSTGSTFVAWSNSGSDGATFDYTSGSSGYVVVATPITAANLTFNDTGFELQGSGSNAITLTGSATVYVASGAQASISAVPLVGSAGMTVIGGGELVLASTNTYSGSTTVSGTSFLQLASSSAVPNGNLILDGGVIELAAGNSTLGVGSGTGEVQFTSNGGGFAAVGAD